jgi:Family of unknown function (DUF5681)
MKKGRGRRGDYKVGKGRPPDEYKFKPGQCGNPKGRPKGSKNAATLAKAALARKVVVTINGIKRKMTVQDVSYRRLADKAMTGDQKAFNYLLTLANNVDPADIDTRAETVTAEQDLEIIADYFRRHPQRSGAK